MKTKRGIYWNLFESDYVFTYGDLKLYFSSVVYLNKFKLQFNDFINNETNRIEAKYNVRFTADIFYLLILYRKIEKRGHYITYKNRHIDNSLLFTINLVV